MKNLLAAMFVVLLMEGCGESAQKSLEEQRNELMEQIGVARTDLLNALDLEIGGQFS
jgi:hypothetical protein